jgi:hypothetical protein
VNELLHSADAASICGGREVFRAARSQVESAALAPSSIGETGQTIRAGWIEEDGECMSGAGAWGLLTWGLSRGVLFWAVSGGERGGEPDGLLRCIAAFGDEGHLLDTVDNSCEHGDGFRRSNRSSAEDGADASSRRRGACSVVLTVQDRRRYQRHYAGHLSRSDSLSERPRSLYQCDMHALHTPHMPPPAALALFCLFPSGL